jgi:uncharacterized protein (TIGR03435 family)
LPKRAEKPATCLCAARVAFGQKSEAQLIFDVASVKASAPTLPGEKLRISGASLKNLISLAYNVRPFQISGGPAWLDTDRFDIDARTADADAAAPAEAPALSEQGRE